MRAFDQQRSDDYEPDCHYMKATNCPMRTLPRWLLR
jgi:hypothetical protein